MKKIFYLLSFLFVLTTGSFAQEEDGDGGKISERMREYVQKRLGLSKSEAERFGPVFIEYFREMRKTNQQYRGDRLILQQKIVDLRIRYRDQFKPIIGEKRSNDVFVYEKDFVQKARNVQRERMMNQKGGKPNKRLNGPLQ